MDLFLKSKQGETFTDYETISLKLLGYVKFHLFHIEFRPTHILDKLNYTDNSHQNFNFKSFDDAELKALITIYYIY